VRYLLQRALTNEWLTRDFELSDGQRTRTLSGPGGINGFVDPEWKTMLAADGRPILEEWGTFVYAENENGAIRNAGIVTKIDPDGSQLKIEAPGFATYPHGIPYDQVQRLVHTDPLYIVRHLWFHVQNTPHSGLGVTVDPTVTPETSWIGTNADPYALAWWDHVDCGGEIDNLAKSTPFDYAEQHTWANAARTTVDHHIKIGYPRLGRKRTDLRFAEGENIISKIPLSIDGAQYANEVIGIGKGEGSAMVTSTWALVDGRLRRPVIITDKYADKARLDSILLDELNKRLNVTDVTEVTIRDHPNAPLSAFDPGDDILVQAELPWVGKIRLWVRVLAITESDADPTTAVLATQRSDSFIYSGTTEAIS
jgi:hypothetical protein